MEQEIWKDIEGYEGLYQVSSIGNVISLKGRWGNKIYLKPRTGRGGYLFVGLHKNCYTNNNNIHRLVAQAFLLNPENKQQVNHKNGIKIDNRLENLEWNTRSENIYHAHLNGLMDNNHFKINNPSKGRLGFKSPYHKIVMQYSLSNFFIKEWGGGREINRELGFNQSSISACCRGKQKTAYGFVWRYID